MKKYAFILVALSCLVFTNCKKEENLTTTPTVEVTKIDPKVEELTEQLTALQAASSIPGFSATVIKNNEIAYQQSFGKADIAKEMAYTNQTVQTIGSVSKTFIGVALVKAIEQGHFHLETNINDILPFDIINPNHPNIPIQIKHLVTHTSSFEDSDEAYEYNYYLKQNQDLTTPVAEFLSSVGFPISDGIPLGTYLKEVYATGGEWYNADNFSEEAPGTTYDYSNISASLTAYLIELKVGKSYAEFVQEHIFTPLGMTNSAFDRAQIDQSELATLYLSKEYPMPEYSHPSYPDGFISTSNEELGLYLMEMIKGANGQGTILSKEGYQLLFEQHTSAVVEAQDEDLHGIFWDLEDGFIGHSGADPGVYAYLSFDPLTGTGLLMMANINPSELGEAFEIDGTSTYEELYSAYELVEAFMEE